MMKLPIRPDILLGVQLSAQEWWLLVNMLVMVMNSDEDKLMEMVKAIRENDKAAQFHRNMGAAVIHQTGLDHDDVAPWIADAMKKGEEADG